MMWHEKLFIVANSFFHSFNWIHWSFSDKPIDFCFNHCFFVRVCVCVCMSMHSDYCIYTIPSSSSIITNEQIISTSIKLRARSHSLYETFDIHAYASAKKRVRVIPLLTFNSIRSNKIWNNTQSKNNYQNVRTKKSFHALYQTWWVPCFCSVLFSLHVVFMVFMFSPSNNLIHFYLHSHRMASLSSRCFSISFFPLLSHLVILLKSFWHFQQNKKSNGKTQIGLLFVYFYWVCVFVCLSPCSYICSVCMCLLCCCIFISIQL